MVFEAFISLLNSIESDHFSLENELFWTEDLKKLGIKQEEEDFFMELIGKVVQLKALVCRAMPQGGFPMRIYNTEEQLQLNPECRGLLLRFEQAGLLPPELREVVIEQAVQMSELELDENRLRLLVILVLFHQAGLDVILSHYKALPFVQGAVVH